jgi:histidine ammonia-lyase
VGNAHQVAAIELLCAAQAADFRAPLRLGRGTDAAYRLIRSRVPFMSQDRILYKDIESVASLFPDALLGAVEGAVGKLD